MSRRKKTKYDQVIEAKRRSREVFGQVPKSKVVSDKRRKKTKHKKIDNLDYIIHSL